jgi:hypothetical protein
MRYKALAVRLRQATETKDPTSTSKLLKKPYHPVVEKILADKNPVFAHVYITLEHILSPKTVLLEDAPSLQKAPRKKSKLRAKTKQRNSVKAKS